MHGKEEGRVQEDENSVGVRDECVQVEKRGEEECHMEEEVGCAQGGMVEKHTVGEDTAGAEVSMGTADEIAGVGAGPTMDFSSKTPAGVFEELLTPAIAESILVESNRYADQYVDSHSNYLDVHPRARAHDYIRSSFSLVEIYK